VFICYSSRSKGVYHLLDPATSKVIVSRDVVFDETVGWDWTDDVATQRRHMTFESRAL
jgi:hypothetical protein